MKYVIGIQPDYFGPGDASSPLWARLLKEAGHDVRTIDVRRADVLDQLRGCHGFMWRFAHSVSEMQIARRLFPVLEDDLGLSVYPDRRTRWHFDDKIAQHYLFEALGIPSPATWVFWDRAAAEEWVRTAEYPVVGKLARGAASTNVDLIPDRSAAQALIERLFGAGVSTLTPKRVSLLRRTAMAMRAMAKVILKGVPLDEAVWPRGDWEKHKDYVLFQRYLTGNDYDTRMTVVGKHVFAFRRSNRPGDFRASGSGLIDYDPAAVDSRFLALACDVADRFGAASIACDGLYDSGRPVVAEVSYAYVSSCIEACPGHWIRQADGLAWREGRMWPEEAQIEGFLQRLDAARVR